MTIQELEAKVKLLEKSIEIVGDTQEIEQLQKKYGFYLDYGMWDEIIDLFSEQTESIEIGNIGVYKGKKGVIRLFKQFYAAFPKIPGRLSIHLQLQGVVTIDGSGNTAKGRWQCVMMHASPIDGVLTAIWGHAKYENEFIKENGRWLFKKLNLNPTFRTTFEEGWVKAPAAGTGRFQALPDVAKPDMPPTAFHPYPEDYQFPLHFKPSVTNKY